MTVVSLGGVEVKDKREADPDLARIVGALGERVESGEVVGLLAIEVLHDGRLVEGYHGVPASIGVIGLLTKLGLEFSLLSIDDE